MANITPLSSKLQAFKDTVSPSISTMETSKTEIANYLNDALTAYESAYNGITSAIADDQGKAAAQSLALVKQAVEVMKNSMTNDMGNILAECTKISTEITRIEEQIAAGNKLTPGFWEKVWNEVVGFFTSHWAENDAGQIKRINEDVEHSMKALEAQLDAIASSSSGIKLGIIGNMVAGGTLGTYVDFASSYNFNMEQWKADNPVYHANIFGKTACFVVGQVEGAIKFFEGIGDAALTAGATVVQGVGCVFGQDWSTNFLSEAAKFDVAGTITGVAYDGLKSIGQYDEGWRTGGNVVGQVTAAVVTNIMVPGAGMALSIASAGGQTAEASLQAGDSSVVALGKGALASAFAWGTGAITSKVLGSAPVSKVVSKVGTWLNSGSTAANATQAAGKFVSKVANVVTKPAQWTSKGIITAAQTVGTKVGPAASALGGKIANSKLGQGAKNTWNKLTGKTAANSGNQNNGANPVQQNADDALNNGNPVQQNADDALNNGNPVQQNADDALNNGNPVQQNADDALNNGNPVQQNADDALNNGNPVQQNADDALNNGNPVQQNADDALNNGNPVQQNARGGNNGNGGESIDEYAERVIRENTVSPDRQLSDVVDEVTGVNRPPLNGAPTAENTIFASADDALNGGSQNNGPLPSRDGLITTLDDGTEIWDANDPTISQRLKAAKPVEQVQNQTVLPAGQQSLPSGQNPTALPSGQETVQASLDKVDDAYRASADYSINQKGTRANEMVNDVAATWEKAQLAYEANPTEANYQATKRAYENLQFFEDFDARLYQSTANTVDSAMPDPYQFTAFGNRQNVITPENSKLANAPIRELVEIQAKSGMLGDPNAATHVASKYGLGKTTYLSEGLHGAAKASQEAAYYLNGENLDLASDAVKRVVTNSGIKS